MVVPTGEVRLEMLPAGSYTSAVVSARAVCEMRPLRSNTLSRTGTTRRVREFFMICLPACPAVFAVHAWLAA